MASQKNSATLPRPEELTQPISAPERKRRTRHAKTANVATDALEVLNQVSKNRLAEAYVLLFEKYEFDQRASDGEFDTENKSVDRIAFECLMPKRKRMSKAERIQEEITKAEQKLAELRAKIAADSDIQNR